MGIIEIILCLQAGKCFFNFLPFLCLREVRNQASVISLLILVITDTLITGFMLCVWIGGWIVAPSTEVIFLKFLAFQSDVYRTIHLLLPWVCFSEEWSRSRIIQWGGPAKAEFTLSTQSRLLSLTCWLISASYSQYPFVQLSDSPVCEIWDWKCPFKYIHENKKFDLPLLSIGLALGSTLFYSIPENKSCTARTILGKKQSLNNVVIPSLLIAGTALSFIFLPTFMAVSTWSIVALDSLCGLFRLQVPEPLITVYSNVEHSQMKEYTDNEYRQKK